MAIRRERGRRRFAAWLSYPLWILGLAPALLTVASLRAVGLDPESIPPPEMPLLPTSTALFAALLGVRVVGGWLVRRPPNRPFWRQFVMLIPIAGPLSVGFARAATLARVGAELRDGMPLELAFLRNGEAAAAREVLRGEPAHVAVMASAGLASAAPGLLDAQGRPLPQAFEAAADRLSEIAMARAWMHVMVVVPWLVLLAASAVLWTAAATFERVLEMVMTVYGGAE